MTVRRITFCVQPPVPLGDVTLLPAALSGRPEAEAARAMAAGRSEQELLTAADVLSRFRLALPAFGGRLDRVRQPS